MEQFSCANSDSRKQALNGLLACQGDLGKIAEQLRTFPWDGDELVTLTVDHIESVLERYVRHQLSADEVEHWANLVECRDDIAYDKDHGERVKEIISELANPGLSGKLSALKAQARLEKLKSFSSVSRNRG